MIIWPHLVPDLAHNTILIDQEGLAVYAHERRAVHVFLFPDTIELGNSSIGIGKQSKRQAEPTLLTLENGEIYRSKAVFSIPYATYNVPPRLKDATAESNQA